MCISNIHHASLFAQRKKYEEVKVFWIGSSSLTLPKEMFHLSPSITFAPVRISSRGGLAVELKEPVVDLTKSLTAGDDPDTEPDITTTLAVTPCTVAGAAVPVTCILAAD